MIEMQNYYDLELDALQEIFELQEKEEGERASSKLEAWKKEATLKLMDKLIRKLEEWPEYREAVIKQAINKGFIIGSGVSFQVGERRYTVSRVGDLAGGRPIRAEIEFTNLNDPEFGLTHLSIGYQQPKSKLNHWYSFTYFEGGSSWRHETFGNIEEQYQAGLNLLDSI
jgi:hypothetical protein